MKLAEKYYLEKFGTRLKAQDAFFASAGAGGEWAVFLDFETPEGVSTDPDGLFVRIDDTTGELIEIPFQT